MKQIPNYNDHEADYDLDHQITKEVGKLNTLLDEINADRDARNRKSILKALAETIIENF